MASNKKLLNAIKGSIANYSGLAPLQLVAELRNPSMVSKMKKYGADEAQIHRLILILQEHKPNSKELMAYLNSSLV